MWGYVMTMQLSTKLQNPTFHADLELCESSSLLSALVISYTICGWFITTLHLGDLGSHIKCSSYAILVQCKATNAQEPTHTITQKNDKSPSNQHIYL